MKHRFGQGVSHAQLLCDEMNLTCGVVWNSQTHDGRGCVDEELSLDRIIEALSFLITLLSSTDARKMSRHLVGNAALDETTSFTSLALRLNMMVLKSRDIPASECLFSIQEEMKW